MTIRYTKTMLWRSLAAASLTLLVLLAGCVSVQETPLAKDAIQKGQRTVVLVFAAPGPTLAEDDSKGETAAKLVPGLGLVVQDAQDQRDLSASKDLQQYLPPFHPTGAFSASALSELGKTPAAGRWMDAADAGLSPEKLRELNKADDVVDWRRKFATISYEPRTPSRDYSKLLELDGAMVFEINVSYGLEADGEGNETPALWSVARLYNASSAHRLWRHEEKVLDADPAAKKLLYDYERDPAELERRWTALLPRLAQQTAAAFARSEMGMSEPVLPETPAAPGPGLPGQPTAGAAPGTPGYVAPVNPAAAPYTQPVAPGTVAPSQPYQPGQPGYQGYGTTTAMPH